MTAVTTDCVVPLEHLALAVLRDHADANAVLILLDGIDRPADPTFDAGKLRHPVAQHAFGQILRDPLAVLEIVLVDHFAKWRRVPVFGVQVHVRRHPAQGKAGRQHAGGTHLLEYTPGIKVLHGPLLEPLPLRDAMLLRAPLDDRARNSALRELDCHRHADRAAADNHDLSFLLNRPHVCTKNLIGVRRPSCSAVGAAVPVASADRPLLLQWQAPCRRAVNRRFGPKQPPAPQSKQHRYPISSSALTGSVFGTVSRSCYHRSSAKCPLPHSQAAIAKIAVPAAMPKKKEERSERKPDETEYPTAIYQKRAPVQMPNPISPKIRDSQRNEADYADNRDQRPAQSLAKHAIPLSDCTARGGAWQHHPTNCGSRHFEIPWRSRQDGAVPDAPMIPLPKCVGNSLGSAWELPRHLRIVTGYSPWTSSLRRRLGRSACAARRRC